MNFRYHPAACALFAGVILAAGAAAAQESHLPEEVPAPGDPEISAGESAGYDFIEFADWDAATAGEGLLGVEQLVGAHVRDESGAEIGEIVDAFISMDNRIVAISAEVDPIATGSVTAIVPWGEVRPTGDAIEIPVNRDNIAVYGLESEQGRAIIARAGEDGSGLGEAGERLFYLTNLIDDNALITDGANFGYVQDAFFAPDGALRAVVVSGATSYGGDAFAYDSQNLVLRWSPGSPGDEGPGGPQLLDPLDGGRVVIVMR